jgi:hypothetical protein
MSDTSSSDGGKNRRKEFKMMAHVSIVIKKAVCKVRNASTTKVKVWRQRRQHHFDSTDEAFQAHTLKLLVLNKKTIQHFFARVNFSAYC